MKVTVFLILVLGFVRGSAMDATDKQTIDQCKKGLTNTNQRAIGPKFKKDFNLRTFRRWAKAGDPLEIVYLRQMKVGMRIWALRVIVQNERGDALVHDRLGPAFSSINEDWVREWEAALKLDTAKEVGLGLILDFAELKSREHMFDGYADLLRTPPEERISFGSLDTDRIRLAFLNAPSEVRTSLILELRHNITHGNPGYQGDFAYGQLLDILKPPAPK